MSRYGYRDITDVSFFDLSTGNLVIFMDYLQSASETFGNEIVYSYGGRGSPKRVGFQSKNAMKIEFVSGVITPEMLAIMFGVDASTGIKYVPVTDKVIATSNVMTLAATPYVADDTTYPYTVSYAADGTVPSLNLTEGSVTPQLNQFVISNNTVTVNAAQYASGGTFLITYYKASSASNKQVKFQSDRYSKAYKVTGYTLWKNEVDELFYVARITIPKLQITIDGNVLNSAISGDPTSPKLTGEALLDSDSTDLIIFDIDEGAGIENP